MTPNSYILLLPVYLFIMATLGLGFGMIFSLVTTTYRDLTFLLSFGVHLFIYVSPVIYPTSILGETGRKLMAFNPIAPIIEGFRFEFLGAGSFQTSSLIYSVGIAVLIFLVGVGAFHKVEKTFMDTV